MEFSREHDRLLELIGVVRDGILDDSQTVELEAILQRDPVALAYYVESIDVTTMLYRQQGIVVGDAVADKTHVVVPASVFDRRRRLWPATFWPATFWAAAIGASLAIGVLGGRMLLPVDDPSTQRRVADGQTEGSDSEIATLTFAAGCRWESTEATRQEGQRLLPESLRLVEGIAVVHFDCDVRLTLQGPAQLDLASVDHAMLRYGKVVFSGDGDLERFTLETPFSKIQDEGTEYAVSVDRTGEVSEVHVFDGRVICEPARLEQSSRDSTNQMVQIDAGDARRFSGSSSVARIEFAASRFVRKPSVREEQPDSNVTVESFAYETGSLAGQNGGTGWQHGWARTNERTQGAVVRTDESLSWPGQSDSPVDGSLMIQGDAGLQRTLQAPIRMDQDGVHYVSFLVRKHAVPQGKKLNGWAYLTLRDSLDKAGHISIGPMTHRGAPRISHDGRVANAANPLRENVVYLFVCKILARQKKDDQVQVRIYGDHETVDAVEPSIWNITMRPSHNDSVLNELRVSAKNSPSIQLDEVRIGKTWSSVTSAYKE